MDLFGPTNSTLFGDTGIFRTFLTAHSDFSYSRRLNFSLKLHIWIGLKTSDATQYLGELHCCVYAVPLASIRESSADSEASKESG